MLRIDLIRSRRLRVPGYRAVRGRSHRSINHAIRIGSLAGFRAVGAKGRLAGAARRSGLTALLSAAMNGRARAVELLISVSANVETKDKLGSGHGFYERAIRCGYTAGDCGAGTRRSCGRRSTARRAKWKSSSCSSPPAPTSPLRTLTGVDAPMGRAQREHNPSASPDRWRQVDGTHVSREERPRGRRCRSHLRRCRHQRDEQRRVRVAHTTALRTRSRAENVVCHTACDPSYSVRTTGPARSYTAEDVAGRFRKSAEYAEAVRKVRRASRLPAASDLAG